MNDKTIDLIRDFGGEIKEGLAQLAKGLGVAAEYVFTLLVRQQYVEGISMLLLCGGWLLFGSVCHGAGRVRSRSATKQLVTVDEFASSLRVGEEDEILVNYRSLETILDECPQAYKDIDEIIDSVTGANLASIVAKCHPMVAIKGV